MAAALSGLLGGSRDDRPRTSHALVVEALGRDIVTGVIAEGAILPGDSELSARFEVSRTVLREAMKTLAAKRLIEPKAKVGTRVLDRASWNFFDSQVLGWRLEAGLDRAFIDHLAEMRSALEPAAAAMAAQRVEPGELAALYELAERFDDPRHTPESIAAVDLAFHLAIVHASRNPFMRSIVGLIETALAVSFRLSSPAASPRLVAECAANHRLIVDAIAAKDPAAAADAMGRVIRVGRERTQTALATMHKTRRRPA